MKKNVLASLLLAFATAFALADNLGTASLVGDLSSSNDYVYTADETDNVVSNAVRSITGRDVSESYGQASNVHDALVIVKQEIDAAAGVAETAVQSVKIYGSQVELKNGTTAIIPTASATEMGVVQLSTSTSGSSQFRAATESAVGNALSTAKSYADALAYTHPSYTARTGKPTANASPTWGGTFTVSQIKSDSQGHVTDAVDRTITIPNAVATTSAAGLMSAADKTSLDSLSSGTVLKTTVSAALTAQGISSADNIDTLNETIAELKKVIAVLEALD